MQWLKVTGLFVFVVVCTVSILWLCGGSYKPPTSSPTGEQGVSGVRLILLRGGRGEARACRAGAWVAGVLPQQYSSLLSPSHNGRPSDPTLILRRQLACAGGLTSHLRRLTRLSSNPMLSTPLVSGQVQGSWLAQGSARRASMLLPLTPTLLTCTSSARVAGLWR